MGYDILDRLMVDVGDIPIGRLIQERGEALSEIRHLRAEVALLRKPRPEPPPPRPSETPTAPPIGALLSLKEVCARLSISRSTIYTWLRAGAFPEPIRVGARSVRWTPEAIAAWKRALWEGSEEPSREMIDRMLALRRRP